MKKQPSSSKSRTRTNYQGTDFELLTGIAFQSRNGLRSALPSTAGTFTPAARPSEPGTLFFIHSNLSPSDNFAHNTTALAISSSATATPSTAITDNSASP